MYIHVACASSEVSGAQIANAINAQMDARGIQSVDTDAYESQENTIVSDALYNLPGRPLYMDWELQGENLFVAFDGAPLTIFQDYRAR